MKRILALACAVAVVGAAGSAGAITRTGRDAAVGAVVGSRASHRGHYRRHYRRHRTH